MNIEDVLRLTVVALFSDEEIRDSVVLKGGAALQLNEELQFRLSTDIDLSVPQEKQFDPDRFAAACERALNRTFSVHNLDVIDVKFGPRPRTRRPGTPETWGGWAFTFKLGKPENRDQPLSVRQRRALVPTGASSSTIEVKVSDNEFCIGAIVGTVENVQIKVYSPSMLIAEKLRAICQQHPAYEHSLRKNRSRDFLDIYELWRKHRRDPQFVDRIASTIDQVFAAKRVPLEILEDGKMFEPEFLSNQESGFQAVRDVARTELQDFGFYVEQLKVVVRRVLAARGKREQP